MIQNIQFFCQNLIQIWVTFLIHFISKIQFLLFTRAKRFTCTMKCTHSGTKYDYIYVWVHCGVMKFCLLFLKSWTINYQALPLPPRARAILLNKGSSKLKRLDSSSTKVLREDFLFFFISSLNNFLFFLSSASALSSIRTISNFRSS